MKVPKAFQTPIGKNNSRKSHKKKIYGFNLSIEVIESLNKIIGYRSRSSLVNELLSNYLKNKKDLEKK